MTPSAKTALVHQLGEAVGLDRVGVAAAAPAARAAHYRDWLARGYAGQMRYLHESAGLREDPRRLLPGARSIVCAALSYHRPPAPGNPTAADPPESTAAVPPNAAATGRIAQYARGADYHVVLKRLLGRLALRLRAELGEPFEARVLVDTAPVLERELAAAAGLGWIGKNTLLIHRRLGSYIFLGELITTLELAPDAMETDHCGTCTRCIEACPTQALVAPYVLDARRCISYLTIEHRGPVDAELAGQAGDWLYGCDVCQEVCPHNRKAPAGTHPEIMQDRLPERIDVGPLLDLRSSGHKRLTRGTAARRASRQQWQRNAAMVRRNVAAQSGAVAPQRTAAQAAVQGTSRGAPPESNTSASS